MPIRDELMCGDLRSLYIAWLAGQYIMRTADEEEEYEISVPPVPPGLATLSSAQQALAEFLQVRTELLVAAARHSSTEAPSPLDDDVAAWVKLLPPEHATDYLMRLARHEPGLSHLLVKELRALAQENTSTKRPAGAHVTYATLLAESKVIRAQVEREKREQERLAYLRHLQQIHDHPSQYWEQVEQAVARGSGAGYDEAVLVLSELREVAEHFNETLSFEARFRVWVQPHLRRPSFVKRLRDRTFPLLEA